MLRCVKMFGGLWWRWNRHLRRSCALRLVDGQTDFCDGQTGTTKEHERARADANWRKHGGLGPTVPRITNHGAYKSSPNSMNKLAHVFRGQILDHDGWPGDCKNMENMRVPRTLRISFRTTSSDNKCGLYWLHRGPFAAHTVANERKRASVSKRPQRNLSG